MKVLILGARGRLRRRCGENQPHEDSRSGEGIAGESTGSLRCIGGLIREVLHAPLLLLFLPSFYFLAGLNLAGLLPGTLVLSEQPYWQVSLRGTDGGAVGAPNLDASDPPRTRPGRISKCASRSSDQDRPRLLRTPVFPHSRRRMFPTASCRRWIEWRTASDVT